MMRIINSVEAPPCERCYWVIPTQFLAGAYPGSPDPRKHRQRIETLWRSGMRTFINLVEEDETNNSGQHFSPYDAALRDLVTSQTETVECLRFPVCDLSVPSTAVMRSILDAIDRSLTASRPVYVHCFGGVGRTGVVVCCWLLRHGLATPADILDILRDLRRADKLTAGRKAPENDKQVGFVMKWSG